MKEPITIIDPHELFVSSNSAQRVSLIGSEVTLIGYGPQEWRKDGNYNYSRTGTKRKGFKRITEVASSFFRLQGETHASLPGDSGGPAITEIGGQTYVVGISHGMAPGETVVSRINWRGKVKLRTERTYGDAVFTLFTPETLCWVESQTKIDLSAIDCGSL